MRLQYPMRLRGSIFWGLVLIILACFLLARQVGLLTGDIFAFFWPAVIILFGIWLLIGAFSRGQQKVEGQTISLPLQDAKSARIKLDHGAGRLNILAGASPQEVLNGVFGVEIDHQARLEGDRLDVKLRTSPHFWSWVPGQGLDWDIHLNGDIPLSLDIDSGASSSTLDLSELKVVDLDIDTGASSTELTLPAHAGNTRVDIDTGASSLSLHIPTGVAASIRVKTGIASVNIDSSRFPRLAGGLYQSPDYPTASNRADITIDAGVGSIEIK
jgi:hypothetical protein